MYRVDNARWNDVSEYVWTVAIKAMRLTRALIVVLWAAGWLPACRPAAEPNRVSLTDSAGVAIVSSRFPLFAEPQFTVGSPSVSIGDVDSVELNDVVGAVRLSDERIVIADGGGAAVLYFSPNGAYLGKVGRQGDGPAEFRTLQAIGKASGDTVWAYDFSHHRITFIAPDATVVREISLRPLPGVALAVGVLPEGDIIVGESWSTSRVAYATEPGLNREPVAYLRYSAAGELEDTIGMFLGREVLLSQENGRAVMSAAPLARTAVHAVSGSWIAIGEQVRHEIRFFETSGTLKRIMRWEGSDPGVNSDLEAAWRRARLASAAAEDRASIARQMDEQPMPAQRPAFGRIIATEAGELWVAEYAFDNETSVAWAVFDPNHAWRGSVAMPRRFQPYAAGAEWVLGVSEDELDVQRVELRPLLASN
jgi:hypothetical protein